MSKNDDILNKVNESFNSLNEKAPDMSWGEIDEKIENSTTNINDKVKNSFESSANMAPLNSWEDIQNKLDIDEVWDAVLKDLEKRKRFAWWRVAAILIVLISVVTYTLFTVPSAQVFNKTAGDFSIDSQTENYEQAEILSIDQIKNKEALKSYLLLLSDIHGDDLEVQNEYELYNHQLQLNSSTIETLGENPARDSQVHIALNGKSLMEIIPRDEIIDVDLNPAEVERFQLFRPFSIGIIGGVNNSWIINDNFKSSFDNESLTSSKLSFGENYGIIANYEFKNAHGLTMELFVNSRAVQKVSYYANGIYSNEYSEVNYYKASLMYSTQKTFYSKKRNHNLILRSGAYLAFNKLSLIQTNETLTSFNSNYSKLDYGLRTTLSEEIDFHRFIFGYGIQSEIGFKNIQTISNNELESSAASNFNLGVFVNIRYKL